MLFGVCNLCRIYHFKLVSYSDWFCFCHSKCCLLLFAFHRCGGKQNIWLLSLSREKVLLENASTLFSHGSSEDWGPGRVYVGRRVCVRSDWDIILLLRQQYYLNQDSWIHDWFAVCLYKPPKQYKENPAVQFQILSLHHVNKPGVKQCSHHWQWVMVNDVDVAVESGPWGKEPEGQTQWPQNNHSIIIDCG